MEPNSNIFNNIRQWYRELPNKKQYVEFISAVLSVPVLITVILVNVNNLSQKNTTKTSDKLTPTNPPSVTIIHEKTPPPFFSISQSPSVTPGPTTTPSACKNVVGPITITSPQESQVITSESVSVSISSQSSEYCAIVWSYSLDGGSWSDYSDKNIILYNLSTGNHQVKLKVKSSTSTDEITLQRNFVFNNPNMVLSPTQSASNSASQ